jgi:hypothetical protein
MWEAWAVGDRRGALAAVPDRVVDELVVHGDAAACAQHIARFWERGATSLALTVLDGILDPAEAFRVLAPELRGIRC